MKKQWKWLVSALALIVILALAVFLYGKLSKQYAPDDPAAGKSQTQLTSAQEEPAASSASSATAATAAKAPETSEERAADFTVYDGNNNAVRLSDHFGKPLVVNFWASWCGPCCSELPAFDAAAKQYAGKIDFMMVNLTDGYSETVSSVKEFLAENGYTFPVYYDTSEEAANAYSIYSIPLTVFIRADGTVMDSHIGSMEESALQSCLQQLTA